VFPSSIPESSVEFYVVGTVVTWFRKNELFHYCHISAIFDLSRHRIMRTASSPTGLSVTLHGVIIIEIGKMGAARVCRRIVD